MPRTGRMRSRRFHSQSRPLRGEALLWALRLWVAARRRDHSDWLLQELQPETLTDLGVDPSMDPDMEDFDEALEPERIDAALEQQLERVSRHPPRPQRERFATNIRMLGDRLGLTDCEQQVLLFLVLHEIDTDLSSMVAIARKAVAMSSTEVMAVALDYPEQDVRVALSADGTLIRSGLIQPNVRMGMDTAHMEYELLRGIGLELDAPDASPDAIFRTYFRPSPAPQVGMLPMTHLEEERARVAALLRQASRQGAAGINILIHGEPGTGKTQFARSAAAEAGLTAVEVNFEDDSGDPLEPRSRQRAYQLCQHVVARAPGHVVLFDEIEDVFDARNGWMRVGSRGDRPGGKAWTNQMLEANATPAIWITNHVGQIDRAYLRRFDYTLELRQPPRSVRRSLLEHTRGDLPVSDAWIERASQIEGLTPAEVQSAFRVARLLHAEDPQLGLESFLDEQLARQAHLQQRRPPVRRRGSDLLRYDLSMLNTDQPIEPVVQHLAAAGEGSLLLHGVPGTGKTALATHLAEQADRPLIQRPASSLLSPYVGMTEKNIARLFRSAEDEGAVVLIDEADSLVGSRETARARWEVSQTNEILVQIEQFHGIVICATNFLRAIDTAALRRFDYKLELQALDAEQRKTMFSELLRSLGLDPSEVSAGQRHVLSGLDNLTPGDLATVARRFQTRPNRQHVDVGTILDAVLAEHALKPGVAKRRAGFA
ncbi:AAA family ATPase [Thioalkalivibrio sp. ALJ16]|uniref:AAA family ATPase n=1 Tax=Thioalkalivibrio sp. ALJ16 TaxID=1158762 RepID=UPI00036FAFC9|nr:AAA family ATPase [Thioalkalivibrio sp. ALJ16]